jgi:oxygen-independent coproporphyrinogen-3 oxidase
MSNLIPPPLSLYIHFPWCVKKCPYCDFNSHALKKDFNEKEYIDRLIKDLENDLPKVWGRSINSVFMGGGTPSLFSADSMSRLMGAVRSLLLCKPDLEVTMEVNPGTGEYDNFVGYREAGINRLSLGIQSLNDDHLLKLGRIHTSKQAIEVYNLARKAGFDNINLDLMFGLPSQTLEQAKEELMNLIELQPEHISYYQLTIEANTLFAIKTPKHLPNSDKQETMYLLAQKQLSELGYHQYEVSAYSKENRRCEHNLNYWNFGDYIGIGAGAHSKITFGFDSSVKRYVKYKHPKTYLQKDQGFIQSELELSESDLIFDYMLNAVRLKQDINLSSFSSRTGVASEKLINKLSRSLSDGLINYYENKIQLSNKGYLLSDEILKQLL